MSVLKWLGLKNEHIKAESTSSSTDAIHHIAKEIDQMDQKTAKFIAAFAYLLGRVANADLDISQEESKAMEALVIQQTNLPKEQVVLVVQMAKHHAKLFGGTENFLVAREFSQAANQEQKFALLRCLYAVSAADESISTVEDNEIRQIASELQIDQRDLASIRSEFKDYLAVLKTK